MSAYNLRGTVKCTCDTGAGSGLMVPTLHVWAGGAGSNDGALGWAGVATKDVTEASKKSEAAAHKELAKLKQAGEKALRMDREKSSGPSASSSGFAIATAPSAAVATPIGVAVGVAALLLCRSCAEAR